MEVQRITHAFADIWIAAEERPECDYYYGGTRMVESGTPDEEVLQELRRLAISESALKNRLINFSCKNHLAQKYADRLPSGFGESVVGGGRCIIRPRDKQTWTILRSPTHEHFRETIVSIFEDVGAYLNHKEGRIKLTPDFGRYAGLADLLAEFTPQVLGIDCAKGGCGGKSSYSSTGIIAALHAVGRTKHKDDAITLIGSDGALGSDILQFVCQEKFHDLAVCDLAYDASPPSAILPETPIVFPAVNKKFTDACLRRGGTIIATTLGQELENSHWWLIPRGTFLFLAHNLALPEGEKGIDLARRLARQGVETFPGQILTLGGALTSRLEWFWRQSKINTPFDKQLAHTLVKDTVQFLMAENEKIMVEKQLSPYEAMLFIAASI